MARHAKTEQLIDAAVGILREHRPMTVRQVFYQLVSRQVIKNDRSQYSSVSRCLVNARKEGIIPWAWVEDRLRRPRCVSMWSGLAAFADTARRSYRRDVWETQPCYIEAWLEKDALAGIVEDVLDPYGVTLNVGRGYDGWDSIRNAAERFGDGKGKVILYLGDFDPSGEDMLCSLRGRLGFFHCEPEIVKCALTGDDILRYQLPPDPAKRTDTRSKRFIEKHGDLSVELDALPVDVLRDRLVGEVESRMDLAALAGVKVLEETERSTLVEALSSVH